MGNITLNEGPGKGVAVLVSSLFVALLWEEANMMALGANSNGPLDVVRSRTVSLLDGSLHTGDLPVENMLVLSLRHPIAEVVDMVRSCRLVRSLLLIQSQDDLPLPLPTLVIHCAKSGIM